MLRTFTPVSPYRGLADNPFPGLGTGAHLARHTVIYGRNGSGKSTFSEYLRHSRGDSEATSELHGSYFDTSQDKVCNGKVPSFVVDAIHVFNRFYVQDNLEQFLSGAGTGVPIVVLGRENLDAHKAVRAHAAEIVRHEARTEWASLQRTQAQAQIKAAIEAVKSAVVDALTEADPAIYNTTRFTVTKAEQLLRRSIVPENKLMTLQENISAANESDKSPVDFTIPQLDFIGIMERLVEIHSRDVVNVVNEALSADTRLAAWVEQGLNLHAEGEECKFCGNGVLTAERLRSFTNHFNQSLKDLQSDARELIDVIDRFERTLSESHWLPASSALLGTYEKPYSEILNNWRGEAAAAVSWCQTAANALRAIIADPLATPTLPDSIKLLPSTAELKKLEQLIQDHNEACRDQSSHRNKAIQSIQHEIADRERERYDSARARVDRSERLLTALTETIDRNKDAIIFQRGRMSDTSAMAANIDRDLRLAFGHDHLRVQMADDNKGYRITRRGEVAVNLSEGERHSIALLYFLRTLERSGLTPQDDIVVVDDPVTSLDREALFAAYSLLSVRLKEFGQTILLTHDFEFYRLSVMGKKSAYGSSQKLISEGVTAEISFPAVNFLEIVAERSAGATERRSVLRSLPSSLLRHPSEYHYLFWTVASSLTDQNESMLPLLGNAGRRLLEGFISFKAPNGANFQEKMNLTTDLAVAPGEHVPAELAEIKERVVRFGHGMSHRVEPVPTVGLDFLAVRDELRHVLRFIQLCDPQHFCRVAEAVNIDLSALGIELFQASEQGRAMPVHVFGRIPSEPRVAYVEGVRPGIVVYGVDLSLCPASAIAEIPGAGHKGFWVFTSQVGDVLTAHVVRSDSAGKYLRTHTIDPKWNLAVYVTGSGGDEWQGNHQHFLETTIRLSPSRFGLDAIDEAPRTAVIKASADTKRLCFAVLDSLQFILPPLLSMLATGIPTESAASKL